MKRAVLILSAICAAAMAALVAIFFVNANKQETEKNRDKTAAARAARWPKDQEQQVELKQEEVPNEEQVQKT